MKNCIIEQQVRLIPASMRHFLDRKDENYCSLLKDIPLFDPQKTARFSFVQKQHFAAVFYHLRGHFIDFMWYLANFCANEAIKNMIIANIHEEIGVGNLISHEMLYERFAQECGVDIHDEIIAQSHYLPFARDFNKQHLQWLSEHDNHSRLAAFSAYERLDNIDYFYLLALAKSFNVSPKGLTFFNVHIHVKHFDSSLDLLLPIWEQEPQKVSDSFEFIGNHQVKMWRTLSDELFNLA